MKNYLIGGLICLVAALTIGIEPVQRFMNEAVNRGTLRGVEKCMDYSKSELLSQEAVKASCVQSFHRRPNLPGLATGQAGPRIDNEVVGWAGRLENKTSDHVTTWIEIVVILFDKEGKEKEFFAETPIWINPLGEAEFRVEFPDLEPKRLDELKFCDRDDEAPMDCMDWGVADVMGLAI